MNLKHFYYRGYFNGGVQLSQPAKNSDARRSNDEKNEKVFKAKNRTLTTTAQVRPFSDTKIEKITNVPVLRLRVQNPGLLPGIGYPHEVGYAGEFKLGFGFDHVTGLPVLPGSSVKGVLRSVFPQLKFEAENPLEWTKEPDKKQKAKAKYILQLLERLPIDIPADMKTDSGLRLAHAVELAIFHGCDVSAFYSEKASWPIQLMSRHDVFLDALPVAFGKDSLLGRDALTPHGDNPLKNPTPIPFLKVMPGVTFGFYFRLHNTQIGSLSVSAEQKRRIFAEILCTVGAGAKTNVGYGQFEAEKAEDRLS